MSACEVEEAPEVIDKGDIIQQADDLHAGIQHFQVLVGAMLEHPVFLFLSFLVIVANCLILIFQTDPVISRESYAALHIGESVIDTMLICEILLKWCYKFRHFWLNPWNILDFVLALSLIIGSKCYTDSNVNLLKGMRVLRAIRCVKGLVYIPGAAVLLKVFVRSLPDMFYIFLVLLIIMVVFATLGVMTFRTALPQAFGNMFVALYTVFICITQDGWVEIYRGFDDIDSGIYFLASLYFITFITSAALIMTNLLVAIFTTNLVDAMGDEDMTATESSLSLEGDVHDIIIEEVVSNSSKMQQTDLLTMITREEVIELQGARSKNMAEAVPILRELESIVKETQNLAFNREQDQELILRSKRASLVNEFLRKNDVAAGRSGDMLLTLMALEEANIIDLLSDDPLSFHWDEIGRGHRAHPHHDANSTVREVKQLDQEEAQAAGR